MQVDIVVILLSLCASLALPVPVDKNNQMRNGREISPEELELQLEDIENRINAVRTKVKEEAKENKEHLETTKGTPPTSPTEKLVERTTQAQESTTVGNVKTTKFIVVKETSEPSTSTPNPPSKEQEQATITKISKIPTTVETTSVVTKVEIEETGGEEEKSLEKNKEKSEGSFSVEKVTEVEEKGEIDKGSEEEVVEKVEAVEQPENSKRSFVVEKVTEEEEKEKDLTAEKQESSKRSFVVEKVTEKEEEKDETDEESENSKRSFVVEKVTEKKKAETVKEPVKIEVTKVDNDDTDWNEEEDLKRGKQEKSEKPTERVSTGKVAVTTPVKTAKTEFKVQKITPSPKPTTKSEQSQVVKVEQVPPKQAVVTKVSKVQQIAEDEDLKEDAASASTYEKGKIEVTVEKVSEETSTPKETSPAKSGEKKIIVEVEKLSPSTDKTETKVEAVAETEKTTAKPTREVPTSKPLVDEVISVEKITPSQRPTSGKPQSSVVKIVKVPSEDEDLEYSEENVNSKRSYDAPGKTRDSKDEAALELELEGGQAKEQINKLAEEFDKALKAERNGKEKPKTAEPVKTTKPTEGPATGTAAKVTKVEVTKTTERKGDETEKELDSIAADDEPENVEAKMSDEELELAELADEKMNDDVKKETKPTEKPTPVTPKEVVVKVEKVPKVTMQVTKVNKKKVLSEKETAKEEKKLKDELTSELEQEKQGSPAVITKIEKLGDSSDSEPAAEKARDNPEPKPESKEPVINKEEEEQEAVLEGDADTKTKRAASVVGINPEEQLEHLLAM